jgi:hypothetical protein
MPVGLVGLVVVEVVEVLTATSDAKIAVFVELALCLIISRRSTFAISIVSEGSIQARLRNRPQLTYLLS